LRTHWRNSHDSRTPLFSEPYAAADHSAPGIEHPVAGPMAATSASTWFVLSKDYARERRFPSLYPKWIAWFTLLSHKQR
jgi:hypothetical protein